MAHQALIAKGDIAKHVSGARLWNRLMELAQFGALPKGGVNRQALSGEEIAARACLVRWAKTIGLEPSTDAAANLFLSYRGKEPALPPVLIGSHIDSQPTGGKFDGALGVLAALESVEAIIANRVRPRRTVEIVAWMNEEGSRFAPGMMGSAVFSGARKLSDILTVRDAAGVSVESELHRLLTAEPQLRQRPFGMKPAAFLEIHIEQGPVLENKNKSVGIVTGIQGKRTFRVQVDGEEAHAGTSPRIARRDALVAAIDVVHALQNAMWDPEDVVRFTVGMFNVTPNAPSVVPARVVFSIDLRHPDVATLRKLGDAIPEVCQAARVRCDISVKELLHDPPLEFPKSIRHMIQSVAQALGVSWMNIASGAGHDARYLHYVCPTGMIFIPCRNGISHNEAESVQETHAADGTRVLAEATFTLANTI
jgi:N-carbamoyl-L-amino-acid hydrolase